MKGLEVTFGNKTSFGFATGNDVVDIHVEKNNDRIDLSFGELNIEQGKLLYYTLDSAEDLKIGDEIVIKIKEIDKVSKPVYTCTKNEHPADPDEKGQILQNMLDEFRELEAKLKEAGLIDLN
jgi:hypothetical protein